MNGPPTKSDFWAKLRYRDGDRATGEIVAWHPLIAHSADVAATMEVLLTETIVNRRLARLAGWKTLSDVHVARLCVLAALHDAGKVNHSFQNQAFPGAGRSKGHVQPILNVLPTDSLWEDVLQPLGLEPTMTWFAGRRDPEHVLVATWAHHGEPKRGERDSATRIWEPRQDRDPRSELQRLGEAATEWFPDAYREADPFPDGATGFQHAYNGVLTLADWIGSGFPYLEAGEDDVLMRARTCAEDRLQASALIARTHQEALDEPVGFSGILKNAAWSPHCVQRETLSHPIHDDGGLTVLESDTGSGKTEAALARFFRLYRQGEVDGMYFAVPTRTAAKQLYERVYAAVQRVYADRTVDPPPVIQAVPGYVKADGVEGTPVGRFEVHWHDATEEDAVRERRWASEDAKRYLAGAIVVGTVDQVLLSTLQVRYAHMRSAALSRHFLVVDEVHASDAYMTQILDAVLDRHLRAGGHAVLMSATLGTAARVRLTQANDRAAEIPPPDDAASTGYPLVTHVDAARRDPTSIETAPTGYRKTVTMTLASIAGDPGAIADRAVDAARRGARVLVIRNLVDDCIDVHEAVEARLGPDETDLLLRVNGVPTPHHSRYADADRARLDDAIEDAFDEDAPMRGVIAVATQTVQMSLDLSASLMLTDLCPVDVLLQRIGRLHRHGRDDHPDGFERPECVVLVPEDRDLSGAIVSGSDAAGWKGPHGLGTVYDDLRVLEATWRLLEDDDRRTWTIPDDNRSLVEYGTHPDVLAGIVEEPSGDAADAWARHQRWVQGRDMADKITASHALVQWNEAFGEQRFRDALEKVKTRLGEDDVRVALSDAMRGPFDDVDDATIRALSIPQYRLRERGETLDLDDDPEVDAVAVDGGFRFTVLGTTFRYDRLGLQDVDA